MLLPPDALCRAILDEMSQFDSQPLSDFEKSFISSNTTRTYFTDKQKEVIRGFAMKYVLNCTKGLSL